MGTEKKGLWELKAAGKSRKQDYQKKKKMPLCIIHSWKGVSFKTKDCESFKLLKFGKKYLYLLCIQHTNDLLRIIMPAFNFKILMLSQVNFRTNEVFNFLSHERKGLQKFLPEISRTEHSFHQHGLCLSQEHLQCRHQL